MRFQTFFSVIPLIASLTGLHAGDVGSAELKVVSVSPVARIVGAPIQSSITVSFDRAVNRSTVRDQSFWVFGRWSGRATGALLYTDGDRSVTLQPQRPFSAGESVMVVLSHDLQAVDGSLLRSAGYSYQFWTATRASSLDFTLIDEMSTRTRPDETSRAYGGLGADLNQDGYPDLTIINEDSADLRVFLNRADGTGRFHDFLRPTFPIGDEGSPSEVTDFNGDGKTDICVSNASSQSVSVLLGRGDGSFGPQQQISMGGTPRGIAVLDADGDGDMDIVNANQGRSNLGLLLNNGQGVFGAPSFFEGGGQGEWALAAGDMNGDGILDLVSGAHDSGQIAIKPGRGDGTFAAGTTRGSGGSTWMLALGDLNADGREDVALVNNSEGEGALLMGDGLGALGAPQLHDAASAAVASDLGDLDGDGDLDWVTSSYGGANWRLFTNDGAGHFVKRMDFPAPAAGSCSGIIDFDRDGDLDLALIDELEDVVQLWRNAEPVAAGSPPVLLRWGLLPLAAGLALASRARRRAAVVTGNGRSARAAFRSRSMTRPHAAHAYSSEDPGSLREPQSEQRCDV